MKPVYSTRIRLSASHQSNSPNSPSNSNSNSPSPSNSSSPNNKVCRTCLIWMMSQLLQRSKSRSPRSSSRMSSNSSANLPVRLINSRLKQSQLSSRPVPSVVMTCSVCSELAQHLTPRKSPIPETRSWMTSSRPLTSRLQTKTKTQIFPSLTTQAQSISWTPTRTSSPRISPTLESRTSPTTNLSTSRAIFSLTSNSHSTTSNLSSSRVKYPSSNRCREIHNSSKASIMLTQLWEDQDSRTVLSVIWPGAHTKEDPLSVNNNLSSSNNHRSPINSSNSSSSRCSHSSNNLPSIPTWTFQVVSKILPNNKSPQVPKIHLMISSEKNKF